ncbi:MAG: acyltransferase [Tetrasphaera sp.]|nr:acyltransferase [Tetrasphaera sp.]
MEGLRAVAVLLVMVFHAGLPLRGGFLGVDVFFVLSGFLITGLLVRELGETGTVSWPRFLARRARRLLPAAIFVLVVTAAGADLQLRRLHRRHLSRHHLSARDRARRRAPRRRPPHGHVCRDPRRSGHRRGQSGAGPRVMSRRRRFGTLPLLR